MKELLKQVYKKKMNIYALINKYKRTRGHDIPEPVLRKVCESYLSNPMIKNSWSWFTVAVKEASRDYHAQKNVQFSEKLKSEGVAEVLKELVDKVKNS